MAADESQKQERSDRRSKEQGQKSSFGSLMDLCHLENSELEPQYQSMKAGSHSEVTLQKMILVRMQCSLNKDHQHLKSQPQKSWTSYQGFQDVQVKQPMQYPLIRRSEWKMHQHY